MSLPPGMHPLRGQPSGIEAQADRLVAMAAHVVTVGDALDRVRTHDGWEGPAGAAFAAHVAVLPRVVDRVLERYAVAARALRVLAAALREAQHDSDRALTAYVDTRDRWEAVVRRLDLVEFESPLGRADPRVLALDAERITLAEECLRLEAAHRAAVSAFHTADRTCARALGTVATDDISDSRAYAAVAGVQEAAAATSENTSTVGELWKPAEVVSRGADVTGLATGVLLRAFYAEGSWRQLGADGLALVNPAPGVSKASVPRLVLPAGPPPSGANPAPRLTTTTRAALLDRARRVFGAPEPAPGRPTGGRARIRGGNGDRRPTYP